MAQQVNGFGFQTKNVTDTDTDTNTDNKVNTMAMEISSHGIDQNRIKGFEYETFCL